MVTTPQTYVLVGGIGRPAWFRSMFTKVGASSNLAEDILYCLLEEQQTRKTKNLVRVKPRMGANPIEATIWPVRLTARTPPSQGGNAVSITARATI